MVPGLEERQLRDDSAAMRSVRADATQQDIGGSLNRKIWSEHERRRIDPGRTLAPLKTPKTLVFNMSWGNNGDGARSSQD